MKQKQLQVQFLYIQKNWGYGNYNGLSNNKFFFPKNSMFPKIIWFSISFLLFSFALIGCPGPPSKSTLIKRLVYYCKKKWEFIIIIPTLTYICVCDLCIYIYIYISYRIYIYIYTCIYTYTYVPVATPGQLSHRSTGAIRGGILPDLMLPLQEVSTVMDCKSSDSRLQWFWIMNYMNHDALNHDARIELEYMYILPFADPEFIRFAVLHPLRWIFISDITSWKHSTSPP